MVWESNDPLFEEFPWLQEAQLIYLNVDDCSGIDIAMQILNDMMWANKWDELQRLCRLLEGVSFDKVALILQLCTLSSLRACRGHLKGCYELLYTHLEAQLTLQHYPGKDSVLKGLK